MWKVIRQRRNLVASALAAGIAFAILVVFGMRAGEPVVDDPVAVKVENGGQALVVIVDRCTGLHLTEVRIATESQDDAEAQTVLWDYYPPRGANHFSTASTTEGHVRTGYRGLGTTKPGNQLVARVYYDRESAPERFKDRDNLFTLFTAVQSPSQIKKFNAISSQNDNC